MNDDYFMSVAIREALAARDEQEVPVGCVVVHENKIIGKGHNRTEALQDPTAHAEMIAITAASEHLGSRRLENCSIFVTLEPCIMCCGSIILARIEKLVFGAYDPKAGAAESLYHLLSDTRLNHTLQSNGGFMEEECSTMLKEFFYRLRNNNIIN